MKRIAIVGGGDTLADEVVGQLLARGFQAGQLRLLDSEERAGEHQEVGGRRLRIDPVTRESVSASDAVLFCDDGHMAHAFVGTALEAGALVIDASPYSRRVLAAPVVVPEINSETARGLGERRLLASPIPSSVGLAVALGPLVELCGVARVVTTVLESASHRGAEAIETLARQTVALVQGQSPNDSPDVEERAADTLAFNLRPVAGAARNELALEERLIAAEIASIFDQPDLEVTPTVIRAPMFFGAAQSVYVELGRSVSLQEVVRAMESGRGIVLAGGLASSDDAPRGADDADVDRGARPLWLDEEPGPNDVSGSDAVHVARLRAVGNRDDAVVFWVAYDNIRRATAFNLVALLEVAWEGDS